MAATSGNHDHVLPPDHVYVEATKQVKGVEDMPKWENSEAYQVSGCHCQSTFQISIIFDI